MTCHLEWDLQGGLMCSPHTRTPACLILYGHGGVVGDVAEVVASAGAGLDHICIIPSSRCLGKNPETGGEENA